MKFEEKIDYEIAEAKKNKIPVLEIQRRRRTGKTFYIFNHARKHDIILVPGKYTCRYTGKYYPFLFELEKDWYNIICMDDYPEKFHGLSYCGSNRILWVDEPALTIRNRDIFNRICNMINPKMVIMLGTKVNRQFGEYVG